MSILDVFQTQRIKPQEEFRTGLFYFKTGHPIFVVGISAEIESRPYLIKDASEIYHIAPDSSCFIDRLLHDLIQAFFKAGGESLTLLPFTIPVPEESHKPDSWGNAFQKVILGNTTSTRNEVDRSGFKCIQNFDSAGDILLFPQASWIMGPDDLSFFYKTVLLTIQGALPWFLLVDPPPGIEFQLTKNWIKPLNSSACAVFYPWVSFEGLIHLPPSAVVAAHIQSLDHQYTIAEAPANRVFAGDFVPLVEFHYTDLSEMVKSKNFNVICRKSDNTLTIWGCFTTAGTSASHEDSLIHLSRTIRSIRDALVRIAEPFVFESKTEATCDKLAEKMRSFLSKLEQSSILVSWGKDNPAFQVEVGVRNAKGKSEDSTLFVEVSLSLERDSERIGIHFDV
jgi:hypothetical protein